MVFVALLIKIISPSGVYEKLPLLMQHLAFRLASPLSPHVPMFIVLLAIGALFWQAWPRFSSALAESFIEILEEQADSAEIMVLQNPNLAIMEAKNWEAKTILKLTRYLGRTSRYIYEFQDAGRLATYEHQARQELPSRSLWRQIRLLREFIDATDRGDFARELITFTKDNR